jgi:hypothetical protein
MRDCLSFLDDFAGAAAAITVVAANPMAAHRQVVGTLFGAIEGGVSLPRPSTGINEESFNGEVTGGRTEGPSFTHFFFSSFMTRFPAVAATAEPIDLKCISAPAGEK